MKTVAYVRATNVYDDSRATKEIVALAKAGYQVKVLAWDRNGKASAKCAEVFALLQNRISCIYYSAEAENGIGMRNITKLLGWIQWVYKTLKTCGKLDVVHACNLDAGLGAYRYCRWSGTPLVYDIYDYYIDSHSIPSVIGPMVEKMEISVIDYAQVTIICTEERREQIAKANPQKVIVLHNSPDVEAVTQRDIEYDYVYCGALVGRRLVGEILNTYESNSDMRFVFAGYGPLCAKAEELSRRFYHFTFKGVLPYAEVLEIEAGSMAIAAIYEPTIRNHRLCAPNKFYEALALGKPVIVCRGTGIDQIVEKNQIGVVIDYNVEEFYNAVRYLKADPELCRQMGQRARQLYDQKYRWSIMEEKLLDTYGEIK